MNILVTGGTGFLGRYIVNHFSNKGYNVKVLGRNRTKSYNLFPSDVITKETDYSLEDLRVHMKGVDVVIHLASQLMERSTNPLKISDFSNNFTIVENLLLSANENEVKQFIHTSSISSYSAGNINSEESCAKPSNIYGLSKLIADSYMLYFQEFTSMSLVSLRLARLYGSGERTGLLFTDFINKAIRKEKLPLHGTGSSSIEYVYVKDVVAVIDLVVGDFDIKGVFNIGNDTKYSIDQIAIAVNEVFENHGNIEYLKDKPDGVEGTQMDHLKTKSELKWTPKWDLKNSVFDIKKKLNS